MASLPVADRPTRCRSAMLEVTGDTLAALALYGDLADRIRPHEARCRYANRLLTAGRKPRPPGPTFLLQAIHSATW